MALQRHGNMVYVDTTTNATFSDVKIITDIVLNGTHASNIATVTLQNNSASATTCITLTTDPATHKTRHFSFIGNPLVFPDGIKVSTLSDATVTLLYNPIMRGKGMVSGLI